MDQIEGDNATVNRQSNGDESLGFNELQLENLNAYHFQNIKEVFKIQNQLLVGGKKGKSSNHLELDTSTLADIFIKQGYYQKALDIYKRLAELSPQSELLQRKVRELRRLASKEQKDPIAINEIIDRSEQQRQVDSSIHFLNDLLKAFD